MATPALPTELIEEFNRNKVVLFVGDVFDDEVSPSISLASALIDACGAHCPFCIEAARCQRPDNCVVPLTRAAQIYQSDRNPHTLITFVQRHLAAQIIPNQTHRAIAELPVRTIVTTAYDDRLLKAFEEAGRQVSHITRDTHIPYDDPNQVQLIRLRGSISQSDSLVLTEDDSADFFRRLPSVSLVLQAHFATETLLFVGYQLTDPHFLTLYRQVTESLGEHKRLAYAVQWPPDDIAMRRWHGQIKMFTQRPLDFLNLLKGITHPRETKPHFQALPSEPYKFLDYFTSKDAAIFFGREKDAERLFSLILARPLTILYGESGVGKTSLIQAAVVPRLKLERYCIAYARPLDDPLQTVYKAIQEAIPDQSFAPPANFNLMELVKSKLPKDCGLVIILDQFEEFFIRQGPETRQQFVEQLVALVHVSGKNVRCLLSLRSDYLHRLDEFAKELGRDPLPHRMRLYNLGPAEAGAAIAKPAEAFNITLDPALLDQLLTDLQQEGIAPPQLQIVCYVLWQDWLARQQPTDGLTLSQYSELGGTTTILANYLDNVIKELAQPEILATLNLTLDSEAAQEAAQAILKSMITAEKTKVAVSGREIADNELVRKAGAAVEEARALLTYLRNKRIIRRLPDSEGYELAHEFMIDKVWEWFSESEREMLDLRDMLTRATSDYRKFGTLLSVDRLSLLTEQVADLTPNKDALELLLISAIEHNLDPVIWVSKMDSNQALEVLSRLLILQKRKQYPQIARGLGATHSPKATRYLQDLLQDGANEIQRAAIEGLINLALPVVARPLYHAAQREDQLIRAAPILDALERLSDDEATSMLMLVASDHSNPHVRSRATNALLRLNHPQSVQLIFRQLDNDDPIIRQSAVQAVNRVLQERPDVFESELKGSDPEVQFNIIDVLNIVGDAQAVEMLLIVLQEKDPEVRRKTISALGQLGDARAIEPLIAALQDEDAEVRRLAASALEQLGDARAIEPLIAALQDKSAGVRKSVAYCLGQLGDARAVEPLVAALQDEDVEVCRSATQALGELWELPELVQLGSGSANIRQQVVRLLGHLEDARAIEPLIAALQDKSVGVRRSVAIALGQLGDARAVGPLIIALQDENAEIRRSVAIALGQLGDAQAVEPLIAALQDKNAEVRKLVARALEQLGDISAIEPLIAALQDERAEARRSATHRLGQLGDARTIEPLIAALQDEDAEVRRSAARLLGQLGDAQVVEPLIAALQDEDASVRGSTASALGQLGDARVVKPLIAALQDENVEVRRSAIRALGQLGDVRAVEPLIAALQDKSVGVRRSAAHRLGQLGDVRAVEPLIAALQDGNAEVRGSTVSALGQLGDVRAVEPLIAALQDENAEVRRLAVRLLGQLGDARAVEPLIAAALQYKSAGGRNAVGDALRQLDSDQVVESLLTALQDGNAEVRRLAARLLGHLGDVRAVEPLIAALQDKSVGVRISAAHRLGQLGDTRAVEPLITVALQDENVEVRRSAAHTLGELKDARAVEPLIAALQDENDEVRKTAASALEQLRDARAVEPLVTTLNMGMLKPE